MEDHKLFFDLTPDSGVIRSFEVPPSKRVLGHTPDIEEGLVRLYIGSKPIAFNLKKLYDKLNKQIPPEIQIFNSYNAYILTHSVGVVKEGGYKTIEQIGYQVKFPEDVEVIVLDVMPQAKFIKHVDVGFEFNADLALNGQLSVPSELTEFLENNVDYISMGGKLKASTNNSIVGRLSFSVQTPEIMAIGKGNNYSEWIFNKADKPLYGSDFEMHQIILVDRFVDSLTFEAMIYSVISTWNFLPSRRQSKWVEIECSLE